MSLDAVEKRIGDINKRKGELEGQIAGVQKEFDNADWMLTNAKNRKEYETAKSNWDKLKGSLDTLKAEDTTLKTELTTKETEKTGAKTKYDAAEKARTDHQAEHNYQTTFDKDAKDAPTMPTS